jgi:spore coat protein U-like protein
MRSFKILAGVSAGVLLALAGGAQADTATATFNVTATVAKNCTVNATPLAFGAFTGTQIDTPTTIAVNCTGTTPYTIALNAGSGGGDFSGRRMTNGGTGTLLYNLFTDSGRTTVWGDGTASTSIVGGTGAGMGTTNNHEVFGRLFAAGNENAEAGSYSSQIAVTVTY